MGELFYAFLFAPQTEPSKVENVTDFQAEAISVMARVAGAAGVTALVAEQCAAP